MTTTYPNNPAPTFEQWQKHISRELRQTRRKVDSQKILSGKLLELDLFHFYTRIRPTR